MFLQSPPHNQVIPSTEITTKVAETETPENVIKKKKQKWEKTATPENSNKDTRNKNISKDWSVDCGHLSP